MMGWYEGTGWGTWVSMVLVMVAFWTLVVVGIVALLRWTATPRSVDRRDPEPRTERAHEVLAERLARGDIDEAEYASRLAALRGRA